MIQELELRVKLSDNSNTYYINTGSESFINLMEQAHQHHDT